jgi:hypothetical protein
LKNNIKYIFENFDFKRKHLLFLLVFLSFPILTIIIEKIKKNQIDKYLENVKLNLSNQEIKIFESWVKDNFVRTGFINQFNINSQKGGLTIVILNKKIPFVIHELSFNAAYDPSFDILYIDEKLIKYSLEVGLRNSTGDGIPPLTIDYIAESKIGSNLLTFILLHELGHRKLHSHFFYTFDAFNPEGEFSLSSENHRFETEADSFALHSYRVLNVNGDTLEWKYIFNSIVTMSALNFLYQIPSASGALISIPTKSHPSLILRSSQLLKQISEFADTSSSTNQLAKMYSYLMKGSINSIVAEISSLQGDNIIQILLKPGGLFIIYKSGKVGILDFSKYSDGDLAENLKEKRILNPQIYDNNAPKNIKDILGSVHIWYREHIWVWKDTIFMIAPFLAEDRIPEKIETYSIFFAEKNNNWTWRKLKDIGGFKDINSPKLALLEDNQIIIYGDNDEEEKTYFFKASLSSSDKAINIFESKTIDSSFDRKNINIHWTKSLKNEVFQYITVGDENYLKKAYFYKWNFENSISKQVVLN